MKLYIRDELFNIVISSYIKIKLNDLTYCIYEVDLDGNKVSIK